MMRKEYDFSKGKRGAVVPPGSGKVRITIRIDEDVIQYFRDQVTRAGGGNYQTMLNDALRTYIGEKTEPLEKKLRKVIREELNRRGAA